MDFPAVILNMETKLNAQENLGLCAVTGTSAGCQSNEVRLQQQGLCCSRGLQGPRAAALGAATLEERSQHAEQGFK